MYIARRRLGYSVREMAGVMKVRLQTYQRWENGQDPIHVEIWARVDALFADQENKITALLAQVPADADRFEVPIRRYENPGHPFHEAMQQIVMFARMRDPRIVPVFPADDVYTPRPGRR
jgi:transcriptional regulator with XRE-family HTH domain